MIKKILEIAEGWKNLLSKKENIERVATYRLNICNTCEHKSSLNRCTKCGCPLASKCRSTSSSCPLSKWGPVKEIRGEIIDCKTQKII